MDKSNDLGAHIEEEDQCVGEDLETGAGKTLNPKTLNPGRRN